MKVAVYNRFLQSMGGGERHSSMLAQVMADEGHEVDLVGHEDVGKEILADHLGLNLGKVSLRIVPDRGEPQVARLSAEYELFVNASYMSRVKAQAARNLYLCYFPTPFDHDLAGWQRRLVRAFGPHVRQARPGVVEWGLGWFPPEGGRRRTWVWTSGRASLQLAGGRPSGWCSTSAAPAPPARPRWSSPTRAGWSWPGWRPPRPASAATSSTCPPARATAS